MSKVLFQITPLRCHGCGKEIEDKLLEHRGVLWAKVFPKIGRIRTEFDESETSADHLEGLIAGKNVTSSPSFVWPFIVMVCFIGFSPFTFVYVF